MYNTVLLKLSGEALGSNTGPYDFKFINYLAKQIKDVRKKGVKIGIVCGGGNICRGRTFEKLGMKRPYSDYVGMSATVMNSEVLSSALTLAGVKNKVLTLFPCGKVEKYSTVKANKYLKAGNVVIFGGGTGKPFCSTDKACAMRAKDIKADVILFAKNGTDGVYDSDPASNPKAKKYDELSFSDIMKMNLKVIDFDAAKICKNNNIKGFVFDMAAKDSIKKASLGKIKGTIIK